MQTVLIVGTWSSGTTAVTGYLSRLGGFTCPPTIKTSDPKTPDSHESTAFRHAVAAVHDEMSLEKIGDPADFSTWFAPWHRQQERRATLNGKKFIVLKHPLSAFLIGEIHDICQPHIVVVKRPFEKIEDTRLRRGWAQNYGKVGAKILYPAAFSSLEDRGIPFLSVEFTDFLKSRETRDEIGAYCGLTPTAEDLASAEAWVR